MTYHKSDFHYDLPDERIARYPLPEHNAARMLVARAMDANTVELGDHQVRDLPDYLDPADLLVFNNTRVLPARLYGHKASGGKIEILIERLKSPGQVRGLNDLLPRPGPVLQAQPDGGGVLGQGRDLVGHRRGRIGTGGEQGAAR